MTFIDRVYDAKSVVGVYCSDGREEWRDSEVVKRDREDSGVSSATEGN